MTLVKLFAAVTISILTFGFTETKAADTHIIKTKAHKDANKIQTEAVDLKKAALLDFSKGEDCFLLGESYLFQGNPADAVKELEKAFDLKFTPDKVIPLLARAYMLVDSNHDVLALDGPANELLDESKVHYLAYKTFAALRTQQLALAKKTVADAKKLSVSSLYSMLANTYLHVEERQIDAASELVNKMLVINPQHPEVLMLQGVILTAKGNHLLASWSYKKYLMAQPNASVVQLRLAGALLKAKAYVEAEKYADVILEVSSRQPFANYIKAMVAYQAKDYAKAAESAELALQADVNQFNLKLVAGVSAFQLKDYEQSYYHLSAIAHFLTPENIAQRMLAFSQTVLSQTKDASQRVNKGVLKLIIDDASGAEALETAMNPDLIAVELALAHTEVQLGNTKKAKAAADSLLIKYPNKPGVHNLMATIHTREGQLDNAWLSLQKSLLVVPDSIFALTESIKTLYKQGKKAEAKRFAESVLKIHGKDAGVLRLYFDLGRDEAALAKIKTVFIEDKKNMAIALVYVEALLKMFKPHEAINVLSRFDPFSKTTKNYWHLSVIAQKQINTANGEQLTLEKWLKVNPEDLEPVLLLADIFATKRNYYKALSMVNNGLEIHQDNLILKMVKMNLLLNSEKLQSAKELYKELSTHKINENVKAGIRGRILLVEEDYEAAIEKLTPFYNAYPSSQNAINLAAAHQGNQQLTAATSTLANHLLTNKEDDRVRAVLANLYLQGETAQALQTFQRLVRTQPENVAVNNNLAWLYIEKEDIENALLYSEKAYLLAPKNPEVLDTYAHSLLKSGQKYTALAKSEKAYVLSEGKSVDITLNYIEVLIANDLKKRATVLLVSTNAGSETQEQRKQQLQEML